VANYDDPGWIPIIKRLWPTLLLPWLRLSKRYRMRENAIRTEALSASRMIFIGIFLTPFTLLLVLSFVANDPDRWSLPGAFGWVVAGVGAAALLVVSLRRHRPLDWSDPKALVISWRTALFIGIAIAELPLFVAFVLTFSSRNLWVFVIGLAFTVVGFLLVAPSRHNIEKRQEQLDAAGSSLLLGEILTTSQPTGS
jgi:hypothetical protein